jgi:hypothetical protein
MKVPGPTTEMTDKKAEAFKKFFDFYIQVKARIMSHCTTLTLLSLSPLYSSFRLCNGVVSPIVVYL